MKPSICRCCESPVSDIAKRHDNALGAICPMCHEFLLSAEKTLRRVGIEGVTVAPDRVKPERKES